MSLRALVIWVQLLASSWCVYMAAVMIHIFGCLFMFLGWMLTVVGVAIDAADRNPTYAPLLGIVASYTGIFALAVAVLTAVCCGCTMLHLSGVRLRDPAWTAAPVDYSTGSVVWLVAICIVVGVTGTIVNVLLVPHWVLVGLSRVRVTSNGGMVYIITFASVLGMAAAWALGRCMLAQLAAVRIQAAETYAMAVNIAAVEAVAVDGYISV